MSFSVAGSGLQVDHWFQKWSFSAGTCSQVGTKPSTLGMIIYCISVSCKKNILHPSLGDECVCFSCCLFDS